MRKRAGLRSRVYQRKPAHSGLPACQLRPTVDLGSGAAVGSAPLLDLGESDPLTVGSYDTDNFDMYLWDKIARAVQGGFP